MEKSAQTASGRPEDEHYLIFNPSPVVAQDLAESIAAVRPSAGERIHVAPDVESVRQMLANWVEARQTTSTSSNGFGRLALAFVSSNDAEILAALAQSSRISGARIVLMGDAAEQGQEGTEGFEVLHRPFSEASIRALLEQDGPGCSGDCNGTDRRAES